MSRQKIAFLPDRGRVRVAGKDARKFLQNLIPADMELLAKQGALHTGILSPQGRILFEFFVCDVGREGNMASAGGEGTSQGYGLSAGDLNSGDLGSGSDLYDLETARDQAPALVRKLTLYKLRSDVTILDLSEHTRVATLWSEPPEPLTIATPALPPAGMTAFADPRLPALGWRVGLHIPGLEMGIDKDAPPVAIAGRDLTSAATETTCGGDDPDNAHFFAAVARSFDAEIVAPPAYHAHRIALGVPEGGPDYAWGEALPHEALYDQWGGVSFTKGCFPGQEVVARMHHKNAARTRFMSVTSLSGEALPRMGAEVRAGGALIGHMGSSAGPRGLSLLRLDRVADAIGQTETMRAGDTAISVARPAYATFSLGQPPKQ